jgi:hypothetical protein
MKKSIISFLLMVIGLTFGYTQTNGIFNIKDFGASGHKDQIATKNIQDCIDSCYKSKGGTVYFPPGKYTSGTLNVKDNVILSFDAGATLFGSRDENDYRDSVLIYADGDANIGILGKGKIDGQAVRVYEDRNQVDGFIAEYTRMAESPIPKIEITSKTGLMEGFINPPVFSDTPGQCKNTFISYGNQAFF